MTRNEIFELIRAAALSGGAEHDPLFLSVAWWNKNTEFLQEDTPFELPALFVEFGAVDYVPQKSEDRDLGQCDVLLHVVVDEHSHGLGDCLDRCEQLIGILRPQLWYMRRLQSMSNHDHGEVIECLEIVRARIY